MAEASRRAAGRPRDVTGRNWPLWLGAGLLGLIFLVAAFGPLLAPRDPLETHTVVKVGNEWIRLPYGPFTVPGFPLGTDTYGRDLLSRLLWGVRPTMILVTLVALIRLAAGVTIGMIAGWSTRGAGRALETLIAIALAVPPIITALAAITAVGIQRGLVAFLLGLSLTGWAETARLVSEQTRALKGAPFIEAARSQGAGAGDILLRHVLRQITPLLGMQLAFEAGATMMLVAALGFLGYYLGGAFWIEITDFSARAISGTPELGQMLANSWQVFKPWATFATGTVVFAAILGFNLISEGLRRRLSLAQTPRRSPLAPLNTWLIDTLLAADAASRRRRRLLAAGLLIAVAAGIVGGWRPWQARPATAPAAARQALTIPGDHLWAAERRDAYGSWNSPTGLPAEAALRWVFPMAGGFSGGPVIDAKGNLYIAATAELLFALSAEGALLWQVELPVAPVGSPALGPPSADPAAPSALYITDAAGGLSAYTLAGERLWRFQTQTKRRASSSPVVGADGVIYYTAVDRVEAVTPQGASRWTSARLPGSGEGVPRLDPSGERLFVQDAALDRQTGKLLDFDAIVVPGTAGINAVYVIGGDGLTYLREAHGMVRWTMGADGPQKVGETRWESRTATIYLPQEGAVDAAGWAWLVYGSDYDDLRLITLALDGQLLGNIFYPQRGSKLIAFDRTSRAYLCGTGRSGGECAAFAPGEATPVWRVAIPDMARVVGGALAADWLYVATEKGALHGIGAP